MAPLLPRSGCGRTMAAEDATSGSVSEESSALDLPSACDIRDYVLQRPSQDTNSEAFSSVECHSFPCSSDVDPDCAVYLLKLQKFTWHGVGGP
ncbi:shieldin complex subunit 1 isoform X3 [Callithrix jacchus]